MRELCNFLLRYFEKLTMDSLNHEGHEEHEVI